MGCATRPILKCGLKDQDHDKEGNALKKSTAAAAAMEVKQDMRGSLRTFHQSAINDIKYQKYQNEKPIDGQQLTNICGQTTKN